MYSFYYIELLFKLKFKFMVEIPRGGWTALPGLGLAPPAVYGLFLLSDTTNLLINYKYE